MKPIIQWATLKEQREGKRIEETATFDNAGFAPGHVAQFSRLPRGEFFEGVAPPFGVFVGEHVWVGSHTLFLYQAIFLRVNSGVLAPPPFFFVFMEVLMHLSVGDVLTKH